MVSPLHSHRAVLRARRFGHRPTSESAVNGLGGPSLITGRPPRARLKPGDQRPWCICLPAYCRAPRMIGWGLQHLSATQTKKVDEAMHYMMGLRPAESPSTLIESRVVDLLQSAWSRRYKQLPQIQSEIRVPAVPRQILPAPLYKKGAGGVCLFKAWELDSKYRTFFPTRAIQSAL